MLFYAISVCSTLTLHLFLAHLFSQGRKRKSGAGGEEGGSDVPVVFDDEAAVARERRAARARREQREFGETLAKMTADTDRLQVREGEGRE